MSNRDNSETDQRDQAGKASVPSPATRNDDPKNVPDPTKGHSKGEDESKGDTLPGGKFPQK